MIVSKFEQLPYNQSVSIHLLRLAGLTGRFADDLLPDGTAVAETLLDNSLGEAVYGESAVLQTRNGLRFRALSPVKWQNGRAVEAHDHQTLAALAELGFPLATKVRLAAGEFTLADVLADAVANFYLDKQELEWTVIALTAYLAPRRREWTNKFGQVFTFDDMARRLLDREFSQGSCGGTHVLHARAFLLRADETYGLLTGGTRTRLRESIRLAVERIISNQRDDGAWDAGWNASGSDALAYSGDTKTKLLITGHIGEFLLRLPKEARVDDSILLCAGMWLLPELRKRIDSQLQEEFCPLTHAFCFLRSIAIPVDSPAGS